MKDGRRPRVALLDTRLTFGAGWLAAESFSIVVSGSRFAGVTGDAAWLSCDEAANGLGSTRGADVE